MAVGYLAADRELFAGLQCARLFRTRLQGRPEPRSIRRPTATARYDRMAPLADRSSGVRTGAPCCSGAIRCGRAMPPSIRPRRQPSRSPKPPPLPKPRPKAQLLRRQQASYTLLSDLQIDAIKTRLKLTAEQERSWPAVEAALRGLATRLHDDEEVRRGADRAAAGQRRARQT